MRICLWIFSNSKQRLAVIAMMLSWILLFLNAANADDDGKHHATTPPSDKAIVYVDNGEPGCFGLIISHTQILVPLAACSEGTLRLNRQLPISVPGYGVAPISGTISHISHTFSFAVIRLAHGIDPEMVDPVSLFDDSAYDGLNTIKSLRALGRNKAPLGSPCAVRDRGKTPSFDCDDPNPPVIMSDNALIAIHSAVTQTFVSGKDIYFDLSSAQQVDITSTAKNPATLTIAKPSYQDDSGIGEKIVRNALSPEELHSLFTESRALIIAASAYQPPWGGLDGVVADAKALEKALREQGFETEIYANPESGRLYGKLRTFLVEANPDKSRLIVYFMGHGWSDSNKHGYLVPVDAPSPEDLNKFRDAALSMVDIESLARQSPALHVLFVFDSCFAGTIFRTRTLSKGDRIILSDAIRPVRQFITAGNEDQKVPSESIFTPTFIRGIKGDADKKSSFVGANKLGLWLKDEIAPRGIQTPEVGSIMDPNLNTGDFLFFPSSSK